MLIDDGCTTLVLSAGMDEKLLLSDGAKELMKEKGIKYDYLQSSTAVAKYNELIAQGTTVGALIHSTC
jgi:hypothetical protein